MDTYNIDNILNDYNELVNLYLNCSNEEEKKYLYSQMLFIYNIDSKLARKNKLFSYKPKNYNSYMKEKEIIKKDRYLELDKLTRKVCYNLWEEINNYYPLYTQIVLDNGYGYNNYIKILRGFFKSIFPKDLELFNKDIEENNLIIKKGFLASEANIFYLESLNKYYINIEYYKFLSAYDMACTAHEYGHAATFVSNLVYNSKDYILNEAIASLYELLFLDYYLYLYGEKYNYVEIVRIFNTYCINSLNRTIRRGFNYKNYHINMIESIYGQLIAASIYIKYYDKDLNSIIKILKDNYSKVDGFELLRSIDISREDLINTSEDIGKLILRR